MFNNIGVEIQTKIAIIKDKDLNKIYQKLQVGTDTTQEEKDKLWKGLCKNQS